VPNRPRTHVEASDTATNSEAKISAAVSSSGLAGPEAAGAAAFGLLLLQYHSPAKMRPKALSARSNIATMINIRRYMIAVARMMPVCAWRSSSGAAPARRASTTVVAVDE
jgi:hypothetical protein